MTAWVIIRASFLLIWLFLPLFIVIIVLLRCKRTRRLETRKQRAVSIVLGALAVGNWMVFLVYLIKSQTRYGMEFQTSVITHTLLLLSCLAAIVSISIAPKGWAWSLAHALLVTLWIGVGYAPAHWLKRWNYGTVAVDGHLTAAAMYIGNPTDSEAEAVVPVHIPSAGDYFLSFGEEKVRIATAHEYVRLPGGVWTFRSMRDMTFAEPLPSQQLNEFRIRSSEGRIISVQF